MDIGNGVHCHKLVHARSLERIVDGAVNNAQECLKMSQILFFANCKIEHFAFSECRKCYFRAPLGHAPRPFTRAPASTSDVRYGTTRAGAFPKILDSPMLKKTFHESFRWMTLSTKYSKRARARAQPSTTHNYQGIMTQTNVA